MTDKQDNSAAAAADELAATIGGDVLADDLNLALYSTDASPYQIRPAMIVIPRDEADVAAVVAFAAERNMPVAARGAGSGLAGESLTTGIVIDFTRYMNRLVSVDVGAGSAVVQAGCVFQTLNDELAGCGKQFGPDPASGNRATIGGMIANNATGAHSLRYGHTGDHVDWIDAVLADGSRVRLHRDGRAEPRGQATELLERIIAEVPRLLQDWDDRIRRNWPKVDRNRAGYALKDVLAGGKVNWTRLLAGSEGTLAVTTAAKLHLVDVPTCRVLVQANFSSMEAMSDALGPIVAAGSATCELMDGKLLSLAREAFPDQADLLPDVAATLLIGIEEMTDEAADQRLAAITDCLASCGQLAGEPAVIREADRQETVMEIRKKAVPLLYRGRGGPQAVPIIEDVCVGAEGMPAYIRGLQAIAEQEGVQLVCYAHAGHGEPHIRPFLNLHTPADREKFQRLARKAFELAWSVGGSISGEHGCGLSRSGFLADQYGQLYDLMRQIKEVFDPGGVLNPGKIVTDSPGEELMVRDLRYDCENIEALAGETLLHWDDGELIGEMEACNGCAVCRSLVQTQSMCPMFRAKLTEAATPRAKANLMRHLITGLLDASYRLSEDVRAITDNCVNCKSCTLECPSAVNIPKLVGEIKARYARDVGLNRVERALAGGEKTSRLGSRFAPLANAAMALRPVRWVMEKLTGIDRRRAMPKFAWGSGLKKLRKHLAATPDVENPVDKVVYFIDMVACWNDHALGRATIDVLRHNGVQVALPDQKSAAMPPIDYGDLDAARPVIRYNVEKLLPYVRDGWKIVCSEPTAALCLKAEWLDIEHTDEVRELSSATWELMDYLRDLYCQGTLKTDFAPLDLSLGYHGPCHLKALGGGLSGVQLVRLIPGVSVEVIDRGCCGIAGTFGFQKRNFELSLRAGQRMLDAFGQLEAPLGLSECATCRMQMQFATGKRTLHPIKLLALAYGYDVAGATWAKGTKNAKDAKNAKNG